MHNLRYKNPLKISQQLLLHKNARFFLNPAQFKLLHTFKEIRKKTKYAVAFTIQLKKKY